jgi:hypothetical protein
VIDTWRTIERLRRAGYETASVEALNLTFVRRGISHVETMSEDLADPGLLGEMRRDREERPA